MDTPSPPQVYDNEPSAVTPTRSDRLHGLLDLIGHGLGILVLPETQHRPPRLLEVRGGLNVALDVTRDLVGPIPGVGVNRPGFPGGSVYWFPTVVWSGLRAA